jgi:hypothetical protein
MVDMKEVLKTGDVDPEIGKPKLTWLRGIGEVDRLTSYIRKNTVDRKVLRIQLLENSDNIYLVEYI